MEKNGSSWNEQYDTLMKNWRKQCAINMWLQMASHYYYRRIHQFLTYPSIIFSAVASVGIFSMSDCKETSQIERYIMGSFSLLAALLTSINNHIQSLEKANEHKHCAYNFLKLVREMDYILTLRYEDRPPPGEVIADYRAHIEHIVDVQENPPLKVVQEYNKTHKSVENSLFEDLEKEMIITKSNLRSNPKFIHQLVNTRLFTSGTPQRPSSMPPPTPTVNTRESLELIGGTGSDDLSPIHRPPGGASRASLEITVHPPASSEIFSAK